MSREQLLELAAGMRQAADWIEANADLPIRDELTHARFRANKREDLTAAAQAMVPFDKLSKEECYAAEYDYIIAKKFGAFRLQVHCDRGKVCKKVTVMKPVEQWECSDSILAPELPAEATAE